MEILVGLPFLIASVKSTAATVKFSHKRETAMRKLVNCK
jgi:hypothetical protein